MKKLTEVKVQVSSGKGVRYIGVMFAVAAMMIAVVLFRIFEITGKGIDDMAVFLQDSLPPRPSAAQQ